MGKDPWLEDDPYPIEVTVYGGTEHCASVNYVGLCTAKWEDCKAGQDHVTATEHLVERGDCAEGTVTIRCPDPRTLELRWEGEPGVMVATLRRELDTVGVPEPLEQAPEGLRVKGPAKREQAGEPSPPTPPPRRETKETRRGCLGSPLIVPGLLFGLRRRKHGPLHREP